MLWTSIGVKREVKEALKNFMLEKNISSENDAIIFLFFLRDVSRARLVKS